MTGFRKMRIMPVRGPLAGLQFLPDAKYKVKSFATDAARKTWRWVCSRPCKSDIPLPLSEAAERGWATITALNQTDSSRWNRGTWNCRRVAFAAGGAAENSH